MAISKNDFKKETIEQFYKKLWASQMNQLIDRDILNGMQENKSKIENNIKLENEFISEMEKSSTYEDRQKRNYSEKKRDGLLKMVEDQENEMKAVRGKISKSEESEQRYMANIGIIEEKF